MKKYLRALVSLSLLLTASQLLAQTNVLTQHYDINRSGWFNKEKILNARNVKLGGFGKLFSRGVDDQIYAQPLVVQINTSGGTKNAVIVATVNNSIYAFDADSANVFQPYWQVNLTPSGSRAVKNTDMTGACGGGYRDFSGNMGIVGTPVIDSTTQTMYVVARNITSSNQYQQYLHALDINTGNEKANSPVLISATVNGTGDGSVSGKVSFNPQKQNQRPGLLLLNNTIYIGWASHCDWGPYHGWVMSYDATTLAQKAVYNTTPDGYNGGIWMSGAGLSADEFGNIYLAVGNGSVGKNGNPADPTNRSESALKLTPNGSSFTLSSYFTPKNIFDLEAADLDFGVTEVLLIPGTNRALVGCKDGKVYLLDRDNMGGYDVNTNNVLQTIDLGTNAHLRSSFAFYKGSQNQFVYTWSENSLLKALPYNPSTNLFDLNNTVSSGIQGPVGNNGALLSVSSNGSVDSTAILWASYAANGDANQSVRPGILRAIDPNDVTKEFWNSSVYTDDDPGNYAKFNCPVIANGKVYLATFSNKLMVYGLLKNSNTSCNFGNIGLNKSYTASSTSSGAAANAFDGNTNTQWISDTNDSQYISVDLGARYDICSITLRWGAKHGVNFSLQISDDNQNWKSLISIANNSSTTLALPVTGSGQYVRMYGSKGQSGYSLTEFEISGTLSATQCATPYLLAVTNIYENAATLNWSASGNNFVVQYKTVSAGNWSQAVSTSTSFTISGLACASDYLFRIRKACASDSSSYVSGSFSTIPCNQHCGPLPTRWSTLDIGNVNIAGSACYDNGVFTLRASGNDIWDTQDAFRFAYKTFVGDGEISVHVISVDHSDVWNKSGIMFRESLTPGSRHAFIALTSGNGIAVQNRIQTDGYSNNYSTGTGTYIPPYWLKLSKSGSVFTGYISSDGVTWNQVGSPVNTGFGNGTPVYAGLALTSHNNGVLSTSAFNNLFVTGAYEYELQAFGASLNLDKSVKVQWTTTLESNVQQFVVERAQGASSLFTPIDTASAVNQGKFTQKYFITDTTVVEGMYYYRLKMVTGEGIVKYSSLANVYVSSLSPPKVYPNPAPAAGSQTFTIAQGDEAEPVKFIYLYDYSGRMTSKYTSTSTNGITEINISNIPNGVYIVEIITARTTYKTKLVIKN